MNAPPDHAAYVTDTLFWYLNASPQLGYAALEAFREADKGQATVIIPVIVLAELFFLNEKLGSPIGFSNTCTQIKEHPGFQIESLDVELILQLGKLDDIPEMHDRLIATVAVRNGAAVLTKDKALQDSSHITTRWSH